METLFSCPHSFDACNAPAELRASIKAILRSTGSLLLDQPSAELGYKEVASCLTVLRSCHKILADLGQLNPSSQFDTELGALSKMQALLVHKQLSVFRQRVEALLDIGI